MGCSADAYYWSLTHCESHKNDFYVSRRPNQSHLVETSYYYRAVSPVVPRHNARNLGYQIGHQGAYLCKSGPCTHRLQVLQALGSQRSGDS